MSSVLLVAASLGAAGTLGFNGELHEQRLQWQMLGNGYRAYNPVLMRFQSPDSLSPFGDGGVNAYAYCGSDPVNCQDPSGHVFGFIAGMAALGAVSTGALTLGFHQQGDADSAKTLMWATVGLVATAALSALPSALVRFSGTDARGRLPPHLGPEHPKVAHQRNEIFVQSHGMPFGTVGFDRTRFRLLSGPELGAGINRALGTADNRPLNLFICRGANGWRLSQAQAVANTTKRSVTSYVGKVRSTDTGQMFFRASQVRQFDPQKGLAKWSTAIGNRALNLPLKAGFDVLSAIQRVRAGWRGDRLA